MYKDQLFYAKGETNILDQSLMAALDSIQPTKAAAASDSHEYAGGCGCTGNCGQSCSGDCESGCSGDCGRSCSGSNS